MNGNGVTQEPDWRAVALAQAEQIAGMNLELTVRGTIIDQLRADLAAATAAQVPSAAKGGVV